MWKKLIQNVGRVKNVSKQFRAFLQTFFFTLKQRLKFTLQTIFLKADLEFFRKSTKISEAIIINIHQKVRSHIYKIDILIVEIKLILLQSINITNKPLWYKLL